MNVSVVIPTHRRPRSLLKVLDALAAQNHPGEMLQVVVVCDGGIPGSADGIAERAFPFRLLVLSQPRGGPAAARNLGFERAEGPLVIFVDDDVVPAPHLVAEHVRAHGDARRHVVVGPLLPPPGHGSPWVRWEGHTLEEQYRAIEAGEWAMTPRQFYTGNASVFKEHLLAVGGFDVGFLRAEDVELGFRLQDRGLDFRFSRDAAAMHIARRSFGSWMRTAYLYGRADVVMGRDRGRRDVLESTAREFHWRHPATRRLVNVGLGRPWLRSLLALPARIASRLAVLAGRHRLSHQILSGIFNLAYWHGFSDELGGPGAVRKLISAHAGEAAEIADRARAENELSEARG